jgi:hypothetical protein
LGRVTGFFLDTADAFFPAAFFAGRLAAFLVGVAEVFPAAVADSCTPSASITASIVRPNSPGTHQLAQSLAGSSYIFTVRNKNAN